MLSYYNSFTAGYRSISYYNKGQTMKFCFALALALLIINSYVYADGSVYENKPSLPEAETTPNQASDASFDKRLPPVLPGEILNDSGTKMKVWSTSGPVPVSNAPEPWKENNNSLSQPNIPGKDISVIVDQRDSPRAISPKKAIDSDLKAVQESITIKEERLGDVLKNEKPH